MGPCAAGRAWAWRAWEEGRQRTFRRGTALHQLQRERQRERVHERRPPQHAALRGVERCPQLFDKFKNRSNPKRLMKRSDLRFSFCQTRGCLIDAYEKVRKNRRDPKYRMRLEFPENKFELVFKVACTKVD
jgi:hypothetical protein